ncbi:hypothetical protein ACH4E7_41985 [Kitasatospora sp. NPDC018058]|uniref:hypothetical protein n=1 Tax=Kitasatospora sp. NPDC018058 TaxID=3364025 RepID=UPI0037C13BC3
MAAGESTGTRGTRTRRLRWRASPAPAAARPAPPAGTGFRAPATSWPTTPALAVDMVRAAFDTAARLFPGPANRS